MSYNEEYDLLVSEGKVDSLRQLNMLACGVDDAIESLQYSYCGVETELSRLGVKSTLLGDLDTVLNALAALQSQIDMDIADAREREMVRLQCGGEL